MIRHFYRFLLKAKIGKFELGATDHPTFQAATVKARVLLTANQGF